MVPCLVNLTDSKRVARFCSDSWVSCGLISVHVCACVRVCARARARARACVCVFVHMCLYVQWQLSTRMAPTDVGDVLLSVLWRPRSVSDDVPRTDGKRRTTSQLQSVTTNSLSIIAVKTLPIGSELPTKWLYSLTFEVCVTTTPAYLSDLLPIRVPTRALLISDAPLLVVSRTHTVLARRAFSVTAPVIWNSLPSHIQLCNSVSTYKCHLKTHLYNLT